MFTEYVFQEQTLYSKNKHCSLRNIVFQETLLFAEMINLTGEFIVLLQDEFQITTRKRMAAVYLTISLITFLRLKVS